MTSSISITVLNHDEATIKVPLHEAKVSSYLQLIENFVRYLDGDTTADIVTQEQALVSAEILDAMMRSAESGQGSGVEVKELAIDNCQLTIVNC